MKNNYQGVYSSCGKWGEAIYWICGSKPPLVTVLPKWFCFLLSHVLKCTAVYILAFMCGLVGVFRREVLSWLFDKRVVYWLGFCLKSSTAGKVSGKKKKKKSRQVQFWGQKEAKASKIRNKKCILVICSIFGIKSSLSWRDSENEWVRRQQARSRASLL